MYDAVFNVKPIYIKIHIIQDNFFILYIKHHTTYTDKLLIRTVNKEPITELILINQLENKLNKLYVRSFYEKI